MLKRIFAIIVILVLVGLYVATFIVGITGSPYFPGMLFLCVAVPVLFWAISFITKLLREKGEELQQEYKNSQAQSISDFDTTEENKVR